MQVTGTANPNSMPLLTSGLKRVTGLWVRMIARFTHALSVVEDRLQLLAVRARPVDRQLRDDLAFDLVSARIPHG
jgi:hypothetical protein